MSHRHPRISIRRRNRTAWLEPLEDRRLLATIAVNTTADDVTPDATLSLREAIEVANGTLAVGSLSALEQAQVSGALSNPNTIDFQIPGAGVHSIALATALPAITSPVIINGYSQPGASPNTNGPRTGDNAALRIQLSGGPARPQGLVIKAGNSTVRGLVINGFNNGIDLQTIGGNTIAGNFIGTNADGTAGGDTFRNNYGVLVQSQHNTIGGTAPADRNLISGNNEGVRFPQNPVADNSNNLIEGNLIGLDVTGTMGILLSGEGVSIHSGAQETIGGTGAAAGNVVSGNTKGIFIQIVDPVGIGGHVIQGNILGLDVTGTALVLTPNPGTGTPYRGNLQ
ncbi:MAG TPA: CSLREA domain-containing protein, partial [Isosphaeraceae bacterium]|nr:CSLREA domain-containing protein [Isosphaeraceae bacterium]